MLSLSLQQISQQTLSNNTLNINHIDTQHDVQHNRLTVSYDLNNYQPLLQHLQNTTDPRWILFIAPPGKPNFQFLQQAGINKSRIITLTQKQLTDADKIFKDALASNNYAAVVNWTTHCNKPLTNEINQLTQDSKTHCFVYCSQ